jgi:lysophospholipase L1-like esterase
MSWHASRGGSTSQRLRVAGLLAAACVVSWALAELALRVHYTLTYSATLEDVTAQRTPPGPGAVVSLGHMLRPSPHERIVFELIPELDVVFMGSRVRTNAQGWRDETYDLAKPPGTVRIVGIGDSVMFGWGVGEAERYTNKLERELNLKHPNRRWEVMTFAAPGYNLVMELEVLRRYALAYDPDLILYGFVANDACLPNFVSSKLRVFSATSFVAHYVRGLADVSRALVARDEVVDPDLGESRPWVRFCTPSSVPTAYRDLVGWERFRDALAELVDLGAQRGMPVVFLSQFASGEMSGLQGLEEDLVVVEVHLGEGDRLGADRDDREGRTLHRIGRGDPHPSARGHALIAGEIFRTLEERGAWARLAERARR